MNELITAEQRTAAPSAQEVSDGPVTLMNSFTVEPARDEAFLTLWQATSAYFSHQPGFLSLRLHRAAAADGVGRWMNVAQWASVDAYRAAHATDEFRQLVVRQEWREFPNSPRLYEVVTSIG